jgi:ribosomal protein S18 acetylase RimI-like enzyme
MTVWRVRPSIEADWAAYRDLRLEMLADTPIAFTETVDRARLHPDEHWRNRTANRSPTSQLFAAVAEDGSWLGTMGGFHPAGNRDPVLVGVYVTPEFRGAREGLADALLDAVIEWSRSRGERLLLEVHENNEPAIRFYRRRGFTPTGVTIPYALDPGAVDLEMALLLAG